MKPARLIILIVLLSIQFPCLAVAEGWVVPPKHPRLLINRNELAALRVRCGMEKYRDNPAARAPGARFGSQRAVFDRLKTVAPKIIRFHAGSDDLYVPAVLHLIEGQLGRPDAYTDYVTSELLDPERRRYEMDAVVALDYCWDAIDSEKRGRIAERLMRSIRSFDAADVPFDHFTFYRKLCSLAGAIVLYDEGMIREKPQAATKLTAVISLAQNYLRDTFVEYCRQRGIMPSSGQNGIYEEADIVLAVEIWRSGAGRSLWPQLSDSVGRALEHYFYADTEYPGLDHGFIHDDGSHIPLHPGQVYRGFVPAVAWAVAKHTRDPVATWFAKRSLSTSRKSVIPQIDRYQWVRLFYGPLNQAEADRRKCPPARNFGGGWVVMRSGFLGGDTVLLFDAGQPYWRSRQHFDAGQFQIYRKGRLAVDAGDDVTYEAVTAKQGKTTIAGKNGDWDHYVQATVAHNCITVADKSYVMDLYGKPFLAMGNQRLIERNYNPSAGKLARDKRITGKLTAYEGNPFYAYAAADLTPAYPPNIVNSITRQILFINAGAILVLDQVRVAETDSIKTWHLQLPARPRVLDEEGLKDLSAARQVHGINQEAGIWEMKQHQDWLTVAQVKGRLFVRTLLPGDAQRFVVGGPMKPRKIPAGPMAGTEYFGGEMFGYEHRLWPASIKQAPNAAYELNSPTGLGPQFGTGAVWGRLDVSPFEKSKQVTFLHLLVPADDDDHEPPEVECQIRNNYALVDIKLNDRHAGVELALDRKSDSKIVIRHPATQAVLLEKNLTKTVQPNAQIPGIAEGY